MSGMSGLCGMSCMSDMGGMGGMGGGDGMSGISGIEGMAGVGATGGAESEDEGALSLAARLAAQFPSARIIIGAPDEQPRMLEAGTPGRLERQMQRLKDLLEEDRQERLNPPPIFR